MIVSGNRLSVGASLPRAGFTLNAESFIGKSTFAFPAATYLIWNSYVPDINFNVSAWLNWNLTQPIGPFITVPILLSGAYPSANGLLTANSLIELVISGIEPSVLT